MNKSTRGLKWLVQVTLCLAVIALSWPALQGSDRDLNYFENFLRLTKSFFPPDFSIWPEVLMGLYQTIQISVIATALATLIALPMAVASSRRLSPLFLQSFMAILLSLVRAIPSLVWALIGVAIVGPYPLAGVIALVFYSLGYLGKFFADALDSQSFEIPQYYLRSGANRWQAFQYGIWPNVKALLRHHVLWMLEYNIRSASIIGYVGAGGLGTYLHIYQEYGRWDRFSFVIILIFIIALGFEVSAKRWRSSQV